MHRAAGPGLEAKCRPLAPTWPGEAVITGTHNLPNRYIIHYIGPVSGTDKPSDLLLASCYRNALKLADEHGINSIASSAISTGALGYPLEQAVPVALNRMLDVLPNLSTVRHICPVLFDDTDKQAFEQLLTELLRK